MSAVNEAIEFFKGDLKQTKMTLSISSEQLGDNIGILDGFVVQAAVRGLLVEVYIDDALRPYEFGDYVTLRKQLGVADIEQVNESLPEDFDPFAEDEARKFADAVTDDEEHHGQA